MRSVQYPKLQSHYSDCWRSLPKLFDGSLHPPFPAPSERIQVGAEGTAEERGGGVARISPTEKQADASGDS